MEKTTQKDLIKNQLLTEGKISRNWALGQYISRLGAIINKLKKEGIETDGRFVYTEFGKDYVYFLKERIIPVIRTKEKISQNQLFPTKRMY